MKPPRSALPLPRYVERKPLKSGWGYFFNVPTWARRVRCPLKNEPLGTDYDAALQRAETVLLPAFNSWRTGGASDATSIPSVANSGSLDWVFAEYRADRRFTKLDPGTRRLHERGFRLVGDHVLKDGRRLGNVRLNAINTAVIDALYERLLVVRETDTEGNTVARERRTTINHAMKTCRRAWNIALRRNPSKVPTLNPFAQMGLVSSNRSTPTASYSELESFRAKARGMGHPSLATAALIGWDWLQREEAIFGDFDVTHYRPKERPNAVCIRHPKTGEETWFPLFDPDDGSVLYPELMNELDTIKRERIGGTHHSARLGRPATLAHSEGRSRTNEPHRQRNHPRGGPSGRVVVYVLPPWRIYRSGRCRHDRSGNHSTGWAYHREGASEVREAHLAASRFRGKETPRLQNKSRTFVRMSNSMVVRMTGPI